MLIHCNEYTEGFEVITVKKSRLTMDEAKEIIDALAGIGYRFSHFEGSLMYFTRGGGDDPSKL
ncbi:hypothetical protein GACE_0883 [Geoglobus acetivorans]|uniref:Uncharacterized protein n=2 Tax=Geoglobus acetivorans TaxID=565033 RepID=A0A0A7GG51_GEOAI|nr:hypothetical protein GACE_0883 [Geoglobus acetivorans]